MERVEGAPFPLTQWCWTLDAWAPGGSGSRRTLPPTRHASRVLTLQKAGAQPAEVPARD